MDKLIHYCWFGGEVPLAVQASVRSWRMFEPTAKIVCWNESNAECDDSPYYRAAIASRQYAFAADYVRLKKLYDFGGVYLDADMELRAPLFDVLQGSPVTLGFEKNCVHAGVISCVPRHPFVRRLLDGYSLEVDVGACGCEPKTIVMRMTDLLVDRYGLRSPFGEQTLKDGIRILPANRLLIDLHDGQNLAVHHYAASWKPAFQADAFVRDVMRYCDWKHSPLSFRVKERAKMLLQYHLPSVYRRLRDRRHSCCSL